MCRHRRLLPWRWRLTTWNFSRIISLKMICIKLTKEELSNLGFCYCPWETYSFSGEQNIFRHLRNPEVHYRVRDRPPLLSIPSQIIPLHIHAYTLFLWDLFNIVLPVMPVFSKCSSFQVLRPKFLCICPMHANCPPFFIPNFVTPNNIL
jgi:hypothetical protein